MLHLNTLSLNYNHLFNFLKYHSMKNQITLFFLLLTLFANAQHQNWVDAEITFKNGEKKLGKVDYKNWGNNPTTISFSVTNGNNITLTPGQVEKVDIKGFDIYKGAFVKRYNNMIESSLISEDDNEPVIEDTIFLRLLTSGDKLKLYTYKDNSKTHYFIEDSTSNLFALRYIKFLSNGGSQINDIPAYKNQLQKYVIGNANNQRLLLNTAWRDDDFIKLIRAINGSSDFSYAENSLNNTRRNSFFFVGAGVTAVKFRIASWNKYFNDMLFNVSNSPAFMIGYHIAANRNISRLGFNIILSGFNVNTKGNYNWVNNINQTVTETLTYKSFNLSFSPEIEYAIFQNKTTQFNFGVGFNFSYTMGTSSNYTTTELNITGQPLIRDQLGLQNSSFINFYTFGEFQFFNRNSVKLIFCPYQKIQNIGLTSPQQQYIMLGYYFKIKK